MKANINYIRFHHVKSPGCNEVQGFAITCDGYGERYMTQPMYNRETPVHQAFLVTVDPVGWTFNLLNADRTVFRKPDGINAYQAIVIFPGKAYFDEGNVIDIDTCKSFWTDTLKPAMDTIGDFRYENARPVWSNTVSYRQVERWYDIMDLANLENLLSRSVIAPYGIDPAPTGIHQWYKAAQTNLYGVYNRGNLEVNVMTRYSLLEAHLDNADFLRLQAYNASVVNLEDTEDEEEGEDEEEEQGGAAAEG
jgi:hypothetical protein